MYIDSCKPQTIDYHRFLDEAGDTTFYGKGKVNIVGTEGVSLCFILGIVKFKEPLSALRTRIVDLQQQVVSDPYFQEIPSIRKKIDRTGFYFHAKDDIPEVRKIFYDFINSLSCSFEAVVGRKIPELYEKKHNGTEAEFYADMLSHLLKNKLNKGGKMVLNISERGKSTKNQVLQKALEEAVVHNSRKFERPVKTRIAFNVQNHTSEPLLNIADYFCWAVQRVFERGETRYYNFLKDRICLIIDLYNREKYAGNQNYYTPKNPLTSANKLSQAQSL